MSSGNFFDSSSRCIAAVSTAIVPSNTSSFDESRSGSIFFIDKLYNPSEPFFASCWSFAIIAGRRSNTDDVLEASFLTSLVFKTPYFKYRKPPLIITTRVLTAIKIIFFTIWKKQISNQISLRRQVSSFQRVKNETPLYRRYKHRKLQ